MRLMKRSRGVLFASVLVPVAAYFAFTMEADRIDQRGNLFFGTGKEIVATLGEFARAVQARDTGAIGAFYSPQFHGRRLGLTDQELAGEKDGIRTYSFHSNSDSPGADAAVAEW